MTTTGRLEQRMTLPNSQGPQDLPGTKGRLGAADATADLAEAAVPSEGLQAGRSSRRTKPEYTATRGRLDHATFGERADASVRCTGLGVKINFHQGPGRVRCSIIAILILSRGHRKDSRRIRDQRHLLQK